MLEVPSSIEPLYELELQETEARNVDRSQGCGIAKLKSIEACSVGEKSIRLGPLGTVQDMKKPVAATQLHV
ncbi:uncharacterized protein H6S33_001803, partial [Morchella sextelata]|uniref:uncharacterized protein n=1 Tax=Morchella sextelata TaxID=1174677 RepID=UPI001D0556F0